MSASEVVKGQTMKRSECVAAVSGKPSAFAAIFVLAAATSGTPRAHAQDQTDPAVIATARELAISGVKLAQDGQCAEALPKLERAEKLHHSPIVLTRLGDCYIKLGQLTAGVESLRAVVREPLPENASDTLKQAYAEAGSLIEANKPKLGKLTIKVSGLAKERSTPLELQIDNKPMPSALLGEAHVSDPGEHTITVSAAGYLPSSRKVSLAPGGEESVTLQLDPDPEAELQRAQQARAPASSLSAPAAASSDAASRSPSHWPAYATWGASAVALGVGVGFGFAAMENKSALEDRCPNKVCPADAAELLNTSRANATVSTIAYGVGIAGVAVGALLFWLESRDDGDSSAQARKPGRVRLAANGVNVTF
jgi:tetratricopeptide (TPR) repeat protein